MMGSPERISMLPATLRYDPSIASRPMLKQTMEAWWAGALWDPRESDVGDYSQDFTCAASMPSMLGNCSTMAGDVTSEPLVLAALEGDEEAVDVLLRSGGNATHALHMALRASAEPHIIHMLAGWSGELDCWMPEAAVVAWAQGVCAGVVHPRLAGTARQRGAVDRLDALLTAGASVNAVGRSSESALHIIARYLAGSASSHPQDADAALQRLWHAVVVRGGDALQKDGCGRTPLEMLSREQCRRLVVSKRDGYGRQVYADAKLLGKDPSLLWRRRPETISDTIPNVPVRPALVGGLCARPRAPAAGRRSPSSPATARQSRDATSFDSYASSSERISPLRLQLGQPIRVR
eukprot:TRINITY_DN30820_c0_g1_i1.p1 TRINITY_DN30820_c0_g1~~TRINITY_DN30820_c0_g1_i1.p1  ORF type:complete len:350 (+),score=44.76 TRINITY_DN30820_c0_g1_i1:101-1150(+)